MLKREGLVEAWHDRRLKAGDQLDLNINNKMEEADVVLLLISPDFLASSYCYEIEKANALGKVRNGTAILISVILRPCEWEHTDLRHYVVTPKDGKPVTKWPDRDEAFLDVTRSIRRSIQGLAPNRTARPVAPKIQQEGLEQLPRSSNLRMSKTFSEAERDGFLHDAFDYICKFFQGSLNELKDRNPPIETRFRQVDANRFTACLYRDGQKTSGCTVFLGGAFGGNSIQYASNDNAANNAFNESVSVESDQQSMFLKPMGMSHLLSGNREDQKFTHLGAAELFWSMLIEPLQR